MDFLLGADPEIFLVDAAGALVSSIGKIGGTKEEPKPLAIGDGYAVQEDNVAIEFNIPPAQSESEFVMCIQNATEFLRNEVLAAQGLAFSQLSAASFPPKELRSPAAKVFGCDPDFNAWTGKRNPKPKAEDKTLRSCGGHLHVGFDGFQSEEDVRRFIKYCDLHLSIPAVLMDTGELRKKLYGKAGAFRYKPYGCEYRSLSNFWVFDPKLTAWAHKAVDRALADYQQDRYFIDENANNIIGTINNNDKEMANQFVKYYDLECVIA